MIEQGRVFKYGDHIDTDVIIPARYLNTWEPKALAEHCMEDLDEEFSKEVKNGDFIVGGVNFGCGSSREHAPLAIKSSGVTCVIAKSFARIFYRNAFNIGLPILECEEAVEGIDNKDEIKINFDTGKITNITKNEIYQAQPFPKFIQQIIKREGLVEYVKEKISNQEPEGK